MKRTACSWLAILACATVSNALACFPAPGAKPTSDVTELRLPERATGPAVIYTAGEYEIHVMPQDLLEVIKGNGSGVFADDTFPGRLQSLLPLQSDVSVHEILAALAPEAPETGEKTERALRYNRFWQQSDRQLGYELAELLESGRAAVLEKSSGRALITLTRNKYSEICFGGRKFMAPDGTVILHTGDWIS